MKKGSPHFAIDLTRIGGEGAFPCPECGTIFDPRDETESNYKIIKTIIKNDELAKLVIRCNKCHSMIDLTGFLTYSPPKRAKLKQEYDILKPLYSNLVAEVRHHLEKCLKREHVEIHSVNQRVKTFDSFYEKIKRNEIEKRFFDRIEDLAAVRVICLYLTDLERIRAIIFDEFRVLEADTLRTQSPEHFGYMSDHYLVALPKEYSGPRYDKVKKLKCEIQVRTILMHAWATVSHHLDYKMKTDIPFDFRKDFNAISGVLYLADTHFELFRQKTKQSKLNLRKNAELGKLDLDQEINLDSLEVYFVWKFPNRGFGNIHHLLKNIKAANLQTLKQLDLIVNKWRHYAESVEKRNGKLQSSELLRICIVLANMHAKKKV